MMHWLVIAIAMKIAEELAKTGAALLTKKALTLAAQKRTPLGVNRIRGDLLQEGAPFAEEAATSIDQQFHDRIADRVELRSRIEQEVQARLGRKR